MATKTELELCKKVMSLEARVTALRSQVAELQEFAERDHMTIDRQADEITELKAELDELGKQAVWQPLTDPGQIREGMKVRFTLSGKVVSATAKLILHAGTDREEVVYNRAKNHYFITSMAIDGTSAHESVEFLETANTAAIIERERKP